MQLSHLLALATTATAAARVSDRSSSSSRFPRWRLPVRREEQHPPAYGQPLCWAGEIHHPCGGFASGCTPDGILVECSSASEPDGSMVYKNMCGGPGNGTCHYDAACDASC